MSGKRVLSTWIVLDDLATESRYPQAGRISSADPRVHALYWRCVAVFFAVARRASGSGHTLRLYTNRAENLAHAIPELAAILDAAQVEVKIVPFEHVPPPGYYGHWRNQFYILDLLREMADGDGEEAHIVLDSDSLCLYPIAPVFEALESKGALTIITGEPPGQLINGLTREQMKEIFEELAQCRIDGLPEYLGGEFFAATSQTVRAMLPVAENAWNRSIERFHAGKIKFNEEAHLLSYLYWRLGIEEGSADQFVKRVWTGIHYQNGVPEDVHKLIVHVPSEKRFGYVELFKLVRDSSSWFYLEKDDQVWRKRIQRMMGVPRPSLPKQAVEFLTYGVGRLQRLAGSK